MKKRKREEELRREIARANDITKQLDLVNELGALCRSNGDLEEARNAYKKAAHIAAGLRNHLDLSFAYRALAEIYAEGGDRKEALDYAQRFRQAAQDSGSHSQIQLSLHVTGWVYEKLNVEQSHNSDDLKEALSWGLKSIDYIKKFGYRIDADKKAVRVGGDSARRKAGLERLCSGLCANLQRRSDAEKYWNAAYSYAKRTNDAELEYQLLLARIDFSWESPVKNAQRLVNFAPVKSKGYAIVELAQVLMYTGDFLSAQNALLDCLLHHRSSLMADDAELLDARVVFLYKYFQRLERTKDADCDRKERRQMYELIADSFCFYGGERKEMLEHALKYYKLMSNESVSDKEQFSAAISIAQTLMDLEAFDEALESFEKAFCFEKKLGRSDIKLCQTRVLIFEAKCRRSCMNKKTLMGDFEELNAKVPEKCTTLKASIYEAVGRFLVTHGEEREASVYLEQAKEFRKRPDAEESDDDDEDEEDASDELDARPDRAILAECMELARLRNSDREIEKDRDKEKNAHGETRMHIAARSSDTAMVEKLIAAGYDVNKRDYGGWTPISEAVSAGMRDNVRALLKAGAKVDPVSTEALNDDENSTGGGITPLMEACDRGFVDIAKDLLKHGASVVKRNTDGWTAVDFLRNLIVNCENEDPKYMEELSSLALFMEDLQRKKSFPVRGCAPQRQSQRTPRVVKSSQSKRSDVEATIDLEGYKRVIGGLGAQSRKGRRSGRSRDESAIFREDDIDSPMKFGAAADDEIVLPSDCEDTDLGSESYSALSDIKDDFLVDDLERKRPSVLGPPIITTLKFENETGGILRPAKLVSFPRTATMASAEERCRSELANQQINTKFDLRLLDGTEVDSDIPLASLGQPLTIVCRLQKLTTEMVYRSQIGCTSSNEDVVRCMTKFDVSGVLDLSLAGLNRPILVQEVLKTIGATKRSIKTLKLDGCGLHTTPVEVHRSLPQRNDLWRSARAFASIPMP
ncbi:unnamed protein product [Nippostrongylus brasiliensis]|uniref:Tonsoku-like protein n=1 Tax=Nippostrongylus brasiliensis TaxID=27835 RepID=A0A0N4YQW4_NIPBR|nr:unnamed protein product [Nippostrongylus brasiliensis]